MPTTDLGSDVGNATLSTSAKLVEAFLTFLEKMFGAQAKMERLQYKAEKIKYEETKEAKSNLRTREQLDGESGLIAIKKLRAAEKAGEPLQIFTIKNITEKMEDGLQRLCQKYGVVYAGARTEAPDGTAEYTITCRQKDLERMRDITERLNKEALIDKAQDRINEIVAAAEAEGRPLTEQEKTDIIALGKQKEALQRGVAEQFNEEHSDQVIQAGATGRKIESANLSEALNRITGRSLDREVTSYVCDAKNPSNYIVCHGEQAEYAGKPYIKTTYEVYKDNKPVLTVDDGRFDGRPKGYWDTIKKQIEQAGGFAAGATFYKFMSQEEFSRWAEITSRENAAELQMLVPGVAKTPQEFDRAIKSLQEQLEQSGVKLENGILLHNVNGEDKPIPATDSPEWQALPREDKTRLAEATVISQQIDTMDKLKQATLDLDLAKFITTPEEATPEQTAQITSLESTVAELREQEADLYAKRQEINAEQGRQGVSKELNELNQTLADEEKPPIDADIADEKPGAHGQFDSTEQAGEIAEERMGREENATKKQEDNAKGQPTQAHVEQPKGDR